MAVAHGVNTRWPTTENTTDATAGARTFSHAGGASPKGVVVVICGTGTADLCTGVDYGGIALTRVQKAVDTSEAGTVEVWASDKQAVPTGTVTVTIQGATTAPKFATCSTVTAATSQTQVNASNKVDTTTAANPSVTLNTTLQTQIYGGVHTGAAAPATAAPAGNTLQNNRDYGQLAANTVRRTAADNAGSIALAVTLASEDYCIAAVALAEYDPPTPKAGTDTDGTHVESASVIYSIPASEQLGQAPVEVTAYHTVSAGENVNSGGDRDWFNAGEITLEDFQNASISATEESIISNYMVGYFLPFATYVPVGATIVGIEVLSTESWFSDGPSVPDVSYYLTKDANGIVGTGRGSDLAGDQVLGGPTDLWGTTWTRTEVADTNFGVIVVAALSASQQETVSVDINHIAVRIYYRQGSGLVFATESGSKTEGDVPTPKAGADTDGTHTESAAPAAALPGADADGTHVESGAPTVALGGLDVDGAGNESGALAGVLPGTDTDGAEVETGSATYAIPGSDTDGTHTESSSVGQAAIDDTDLASGANETGAPLVTVAGADSDGTEVESAVPSVPQAGGDTDGVHTEDAQVAAPKQGDDASAMQFAGTESGTLQAVHAGADVDGTHTETGAPLVALQGSDSDGVETEVGATTQRQDVLGSDTDGAHTELGSTSAAIPGADTDGTAAESGSPAAAIAGSDTGAATAEVVTYRLLVTTEDATGTEVEVATALISFFGADQGTDTEAAAMTATVQGSESRTVTEVAQITGMVVQVSGSDVGQGSDVASILRAVAALDLSGTPVDLASLLVSLTGPDGAAALEGALATATLVPADSMIVVELATLLAMISSADASQAVIEEAKLALTGGDTSTGPGETGAATVAVQGSETVVAGETAEPGVMLPALDVGLSVEAALVLIRGMLQAIATGEIVSRAEVIGRIVRGGPGRVRS